MVATDLDGTIVRSDGTVSARTREALARAEEAGAVVVLVTGRPPRWMHEVAAATAHRGLAVCCNGAVVYDLHDERVVEEHPMTPDALREVVGRLVADLPEAVFAVEYGAEFAREEGYRSRWDNEAPHAVVERERLLERPAAKLLARHPTMGPDDLLARARGIVGEAAVLVHSSRDGLLEISAPGVTKASTLAALAAERDVRASQVVAFGDMPNDLPLLTWAGRGVAVANAHPDVLAAADEVTASNDDDGVAAVLERLFGRSPHRRR